MGSIGLRHAAVLLKRPGMEVFAYRSGKGPRPVPAGLREVFTWAEIENTEPDVAFIANPTFLHVETALACARRDMQLFVEKPIGCSWAGLDTLLDEVTRRDLATYVAYNLRFHPVIRALHEELQERRVLHMSVYAASYLPTWRPGHDHLKSYSASRAQGGGVVLDMSHEFDYIEYLVGPIERIDGVTGRTGCVTLDAEDYLDAIIETARCRVVVHVDFMSVNSQRTIRVDCPGECIIADLLRGTIECHACDKTTSRAYDPDMQPTYERQIDYFLENLGNPRMMNNLVDASVLFRKVLEFRERAA